MGDLSGEEGRILLNDPRIEIIADLTLFLTHHEPARILHGLANCSQRTHLEKSGCPGDIENALNSSELDLRKAEIRI